MKVFFTCLFLCAANLGNAQNNSIAQWQQTHPEVIFIESQDFNLLSKAQKNQLGERIIVFYEDVKWQDIYQFENLSGNHSFGVDNGSANLEEKEELKKWLGSHPNVKIVPRSYFDSLSSEEQNEYVNTNTLILSGEDMTLEDIYRFENQNQ